MELKEGILTRRSIRKYDSAKKVSEKEITEILNMAMHAPSAHNKQTWEFVVVDDPKILEKMMSIHPWCSFLKETGLAIIVCGNTEEEIEPNFWVCDAGAATQNILLGAHALGLGSCWCAIYPNDKRIADFSKLLKLPQSVIPFSLVAVGHPSSIPPQPTGRFKTEKIHKNTW